MTGGREPRGDAPTPAGAATTVAIRRVGDDEADLEALVAIVNEVTPDSPTSLEELRWADATYPGGARFLAEVDGRAIGVATTGRIYMYPPEFDGAWGTIAVLAGHRRRGIGGALYAAVSAEAAAAGKRALYVPASESRPDGIEFLVHRGFVEDDRHKVVRLELAGLTPPDVTAPAGVDIISLGERPDLVPGVHAVAVEAFADIPGGSEPMAAGRLEEFRARDVDRPAIPADGFFVALDAASGTVVGYASLVLLPGGHRAVHDMTAVARAWRGRGVASALKRATVRWAVGAGLETLVTGNDEDNAAMRAVNRRLGYVPEPDELTLRGPLSGAIMVS